MMMTFPEDPTRVELTVSEGGVAQVRMVRGAKRNGLDLAMFDGLIAAGEALRERMDVRAVVLSGDGPAFCAGLDFKSFMAGGKDGIARMLSRDVAVSPANIAQRSAWVWREVPVPVIAAVHGSCFGGGLQIALGADLRIVAPDAELSVMEIRLGLIPDMSITATLLPMARLDVIKELAWTGRRIGGEEAVALGLATRVAADPLAAATALAETIAAHNPHAIRAGKRLFDRSGEMSLADRLAFETELQIPILGSRNQMEAAMAHMQRRTPQFRDPASS